jgi:hypothetical protein
LIADAAVAAQADGYCERDELANLRSEQIRFLAGRAEGHISLDGVGAELTDFLDSGSQLFAIVVPIEHHGQCSPSKLLRESLTGDMVTETNGQVTIPWYLNSVIIPVAWW